MFKVLQYFFVLTVRKIKNIATLFFLSSFNQLCLPTYDSYEELHKMLKLAISEGSEGFGML